MRAPTSGSCQPSERFSARMLALPFTSQVPEASRCASLCDGRGRVGGELADDLLQQVLERHQALDVAVFVDDEGQAPAGALELRQLLRQRGALGHEVGLARRGDLHQLLARQRVARQFLRDALHVQHADDVVEVARRTAAGACAASGAAAS